MHQTPEVVDNRPWADRIMREFAKEFQLSPVEAHFLLIEFQLSLQANMVRAREALARNDPDLLERAAHSIKGALLQVGHTELAELSRTVEGLASRKEVNDKCTDAMGILLARLTAMIPEEINQ